MNTPEVIVLKFLRDAAAQVRRNGDAAIAREALKHEETFSRRIEKLERDADTSAPTEPETAAA